MAYENNENATSAVLAAVREVANYQGGTESAGRSLGSGKHNPGVAEGMTGREGPESSAMDSGYDAPRNFGEADNVSYKEDDGMWF